MTNFVSAKYDNLGNALVDPSVPYSVARYSQDASGNVTGLVGPGGGVVSSLYNPAAIAITGGTIIGVPFASALASVAGAGDSLIGGAVQGGSPYTQTMRRIGQGFRNVGNIATGGTRTDQIASQIPQAAAAGAARLVINGGANDIAQGVAEATLRANLIANWNASKSLKMEPIDFGLPPTNTTAYVARYVANEVWRKLYCYKNGIRHVDIWPVLATAAGGYASGLNADAVHYNSVGALAVEPILTAMLKNIYSSTAPLLAMTDTGSDAGSGAFMNNCVSFTDSGSGTPTGWYGSGTGGVISIRPADSGGFGSWLRMTCTGAVNAGLNVTGAQLVNIGWSVGDKIAIGFRVRWSDSAQALQLSTNISGITSSAGQPLFQEKGGVAGDDIYVYFETTITGGVAVGANFFASGTGYFEINRPIIVNLTMLGMA